MNLRTPTVLLFSVLLGLSAGPVAAADGVREAALECSRIQGGADKNTCLDFVRSASFFDPAAVQACGKIGGYADKAQCIRAITDKTYAAWELEACDTHSGHADRVSCLSSGGRVSAPNRGAHIDYEDKRGPFGRSTRIQVPTAGSNEAPSVLIKNGLFATGFAARNLSEAPRSKAVLPEKLPEMNLLPVRTPGQGVIAAVTELAPGSRIFFASRHLLQDGGVAAVKEALKAAGQDPELFAAFELSLGEGNGQLDVILLAPRSVASDLVEIVDLFRPGCESCGSQPTFRLRRGFFESKIRRSTPEPDEKLISFQAGFAGDQPVRQLSRGSVKQISWDGLTFFLEEAAGNLTTAGSSGSLVLSNSPEANRSDWQVSGVVECIMPESRNSEGLRIPGGVRVISGRALLEATVSPISLEKLGKEAKSRKGKCVPIDGRDAGGK